MRDRHLDRLRVVLSIVGGYLETSFLLALLFVSSPLLGVDGVLELLALNDNVPSLDVLRQHILVEYLQRPKGHRTSVHSHLQGSTLVLGAI